MRTVGIRVFLVSIIAFLLFSMIGCTIQPQFYTVTFDTCGGNSIAPQTVQENKRAIKPSVDPVKEGCSFDGWYTENTYDTVFDFNTPITENITLYVKWNTIEYTVSFNSNGGSIIEPQNIGYIDFLVRPDDPIKPGCLFLDWYLDEDFTIGFDFNANITTSFTLYARWAVIPWEYDELEHWYDFYADDREYLLEKSHHSFRTVFDDAKELVWNECTICGYETAKENHDHVWDSGTVAKEPTCTETGIKIYKCNSCQLERTEILPLTDHTFINGFCICGLIQPDAFIEIDNFGAIWVSNTFPSSYSLSLIIPDTVQGKRVLSIGASCFSVCPNITEISLPDSVTTISDSAFTGCNALHTVKLGSGVANISAYSLWGTCNNFRTIEVSDANLEYSSKDGILYSKDATKLIYCPVQNGVVNYIVPNGVVEIKSSAFRNNKTITKPNLPNSLEKIESYAFASCYRITQVNLPEGLLSIETRAFDNCQNLTNVHLPSTLTSIGSNSFSHITTATIAEGVSKVPDYAFVGSRYLTTVSLPDSITSIGAYSFYENSGLVDIQLPDSVTEIKNYAFFGCTSLKNINIPSKLESIGASAFRNCKELRGSLELPSGMQTIGSSAFSRCISISNIVIPSSVKSLGRDVFSDWTPAQKIYVYSSFENGVETDDVGSGGGAWSSGASIYVDLSKCNSAIIGKGAFCGCNSTLDFVIPEGIETIEERAFFLSDFRTITIPKTVSTIGDDAFNRCIRTKSIIVDEENPNYTSLDGVLYNKAKTVLISYPGSKEGEELIIPEGVEKISRFAFISCSGLKTITLPVSMKQVEWGAFGYSSIRKLILKRDIKPLTSISFYLAIPNIQEILVPQSVVSDYKNHSSFKDVASKITGYEPESF